MSIGNERLGRRDGGRWWPRPSSAVCLALLFGLNAAIACRLWFANYIDQMGSTAGPFIAISRYVTRHWSDHAWFPAWFCGIPFLRVYQPGFHVSVAALATVLSLSAQRAYFLTAAFCYCLGPITLFWLCERFNGRRGYALTASLVYSLVSPSLLFSSVIRSEVEGGFGPRRYQTLVYYGESPHIAALMLLPLVIWAFDRATLRNRPVFVPLAAALVGMVLVTNWTGTVGLLMALIAYLLAQMGEMRARGWWAGLGIMILGYALVSRWLPPSILLDVPANAANSDGTTFGRPQVVVVAALLVVLAALHLCLARLKTDRTFRFFLYFFLFSAWVVLGKFWAGVSVIPQAHRFHLELEMGFAGAASFLAVAVWDRLPARTRTVAAVVLLAGGALAFLADVRYAWRQTRPIPIESTIEYRMAKWFEGHMAGQRVFAPGSVSVWMNTFVDTPQMVGCCDQSVPSIEQRIAFYTIYRGTNAGSRDAEISVLWLKAYGAGAVGVSLPDGKEFFKPFANPHKFDGVLPELWRTRGAVVYGVPRRSTSFAHVIEPEQEVRRAPIHGLDVAPIRPYVAALDDPAMPEADMRWLNPHEIRITTHATPRELISVQTSYAPGWRARVRGVPVPVRADALGLLVIEPRCSGACVVDLAYTGVPEAGWLRVTQAIAVVICILWPLLMTKRDHRVQTCGTACG